MNNEKVIHHFGSNVRKLRLRRGLTQEEVAARAGITANFVGMVERGERNITLKNAVKVAKGLGFPIHKLFEGI